MGSGDAPIAGWAGGAGFSPEFELLCLCSRSRLDGGALDRARSLVREQEDWESLRMRAEAHGVAPLVRRTLRASFRGEVPGEALDGFEFYYQANSLRNQLLTRRLVRVLDLLGSHGIRAVPFKGPALSVQLYGDTALRQFGDLDILVSRNQVLSARAILTADGYVPECRLTPAIERVYLKAECEYNFVHEDGLVALELHWNILPPQYSLRFDLDDLVDPMSTVTLAGESVSTLPREHEIVLLSAHGLKHCWDRLDLVCTIAELIRGAGSDVSWGRIQELARGYGFERALHVGLRLARDLMAAPVPDTLAARAAGVASLARKAGRAMDRLGGGSMSALDRTRFRLAGLDTARRRLRYLCGIPKATAADLDAVTLADRLAFLYPVLRPCAFAIRRLPGRSRRPRAQARGTE